MADGDTLGVIANSVLKWLRGARQSSGGQNVEVLDSVIGTSRGLVRTDNQDRCLLARSEDQGWICSVLCDGIGGMVNGGLAAEIATASFVESISSQGPASTRERLLRATGHANMNVYHRLAEKGGSTLAALMVGGDGALYGVTVGDTRIYKVAEKALEQISFDDTIAGELQRIKGTDFQPDDGDPASRHLSQFIGMGPGLQAHVYGPLDCDGWILLTTDGIHSMTAKTFEQIAIHAPSPYKLATRLIQVSEWVGGQDNASIVVFPARAKRPLFQASEDHIPGALEIWSHFGKIQLVLSTPTGARIDGPSPLSSPPEPQWKSSSVPVSPDSPRKGRQQAKKQDRKQSHKSSQKPIPQLGMELIEAEQLPSLPSAGKDGQHSAESNASTSEPPSGTVLGQDTKIDPEEAIGIPEALPEKSAEGGEAE